MLLQVALDSWQFLGSGRSKPSISVDENNLGILKVDDHIRVTVAAHINKAQCDRHQVGACAVELRADVDACLRAITSWELGVGPEKWSLQTRKLTHR